MPVRNRPLDDSHQPYKRRRAHGPGPRGETFVQTKEWECKKVAPYVQKCVNVGGQSARKGRVKIVRTRRSRKQRYNTEYDAWRRGKPGNRFPQTRLRDYECRPPVGKRRCKVHETRSR